MVSYTTYCALINLPLIINCLPLFSVSFPYGLFIVDDEKNKSACLSLNKVSNYLAISF